MAGELFSIVLCLGCGMRVFTKSDGSCPSCGARGEHTVRTWRGKPVRVLIPKQRAPVWTHACLYLRPYANRFRAAAQMRAVSNAMRSFGRTVALVDQSDQPFGRVDIHDGLGYRWMFELNLYAWIIEKIRGFRRLGVDLRGEVNDDSWSTTFRQLTARSCVIVMDVSVPGVGLAYEADYIRDMGFVGRLVLVHHGSSQPNAIAESFSHDGIDVPCVRYSVWRLRRFTKDLRDAAKHVMEAQGIP